MSTLLKFFYNSTNSLLQKLFARKKHYTQSVQLSQSSRCNSASGMPIWVNNATTRVLQLQVRHPHVLMLVCDDVSSACVDVRNYETWRLRTCDAMNVQIV